MAFNLGNKLSITLRVRTTWRPMSSTLIEDYGNQRVPGITYRMVFTATANIAPGAYVVAEPGFDGFSQEPN